MKTFFWHLFVWFARLRGAPMPRDVNRYAVVVSGKKPYRDWVRRLKQQRLPLQEALERERVYLLSFDIVPETDNPLARAVLESIVLDFFSDLVDDSDDLPRFAPDELHNWIELHQVDNVVDISARRLSARAYQLE